MPKCPDEYSKICRLIGGLFVEGQLSFLWKSLIFYVESCAIFLTFRQTTRHSQKTLDFFKPDFAIKHRGF